MHHHPSTTGFYGSRSGGLYLGGFPRREANGVSCKKPRCRPLAGSHCSTKDLWPPARLGRFATGRRIIPIPHRGLRKSLPHWMIAIAMSGRGPEAKTASGGVHQALGRSAAAGAETAIRVFSKRHNRGCGGGCLPWHTIHMIAIRKACLRRNAADAAGWPRGSKTASAFRERQDHRVGGGCLSWHIIHTIAIRKACLRRTAADAGGWPRGSDSPLVPSHPGAPPAWRKRHGPGSCSAAGHRSGRVDSSVGAVTCARE
jgi:hypothetical protein